MEDLYSQFFLRNPPLISPDKQDKLSDICIGLAGTGGVGGIQAISLARTGIRKFKIADPEIFEYSNINRQYGARLSTIGKNKAEVIKNDLEDLGAEVKAYTEGVTPENLDDFLDGVDIAIDAIEYGAFKDKIHFFKRAREKGLYVISSPIPEGATLMIFDPKGMTAEEYFDTPKDEEGWKDFRLDFRKIYPNIDESTHKEYLLEAGKGKRTIPTLGYYTYISAAMVTEAVLQLTLGDKGSLFFVPEVLRYDSFRTFKLVQPENKK